MGPLFSAITWRTIQCCLAAPALYTEDVSKFMPTRFRSAENEISSIIQWRETPSPGGSSRTAVSRF